MISDDLIHRYLDLLQDSLSLFQGKCPLKAHRPRTKLSSRLTSAKVSLDRIQKFLLDPSREDMRHLQELPSHVPSHTPDGRYRDTEVVQSSPTPLINLTAAISIDNITVQPSPTSDPILTNVSLRVETSTITMVAGPIGVGKSILLKAILGELPYHGNIFVSSPKIGYCAQTPWLQNGTIQQNICGFADAEEIDELWYKTVVKASTLEEDFVALVDGDRTVVGSKGVALSGGQRQRVVSVFKWLWGFKLIDSRHLREQCIRGWILCFWTMCSVHWILTLRGR